MKKFTRPAKIHIASILGKSYIDFVFVTSKKYYINFENVFRLWESKETKTINIFWHNRIALMPKLYKGKGIKILISDHSDGEIITKIILKYKKLSAVRGSTKKGAVRGLKNLIKEVKNYDICITPDGPRGPKYEIQGGSIYISKLTGFPIIPLSYNVRKKYVLNSWDNFIIPYPFNEIVYVAGEPIFIDKDIDNDEAKKIVKDKLMEVTEIADNYFS